MPHYLRVKDERGPISGHEGSRHRASIAGNMKRIYGLPARFGPLLILVAFSLVMVNAANALAQTHLRTRGVTVSPPPQAEARHALIIGNANYKFAPLKNPANDARAVAQALKAVGFDVTLKTDASWREMRRSIIDFGSQLKRGGIGLFYYAGHAVQIQGANYLIPIGAAIDSEEHVPAESISLELVMAHVGGAHNRLNIVILDACRNNPFGTSFRSVKGGLAQTSAPPGTYIAYATAPGQVAIDGRGKNSVFTESLVRWLTSPGLRIEDVFKRIRIRVFAVSAGRQMPWTSSSITSDFYFVPQSGELTRLSR